MDVLRKVLRRGALCVAAAGMMVGAGAPASGEQSAFMRVFGTVQPPYGFLLFCESNPTECRDSAVTEQRVSALPERLAELDAVNRAVNKAIQPATDMEIYGVSEHWTIPTARGDCEDYALLKRQILIKRGWPVSSLLMTVVRDERGEGHAVLTARTTHGDFVLDNKVDDLRLWYKTGYDFVMRQSYLSARVWMSLDPRHVGHPSISAAGREQLR